MPRCNRMTFRVNQYKISGGAVATSEKPAAFGGADLQLQ